LSCHGLGSDTGAYIPGFVQEQTQTSRRITPNELRVCIISFYLITKVLCKNRLTEVGQGGLKNINGGQYSIVKQKDTCSFDNERVSNNFAL
jgi:hypothetical protein